jgi:hypothetical protein
MINEQQRAVVQQALEALENRCGMDAEEREELMPALRQLLEQPVPVQSAERGEPVVINEAAIQKWQGDNDIVMSIKAYKQLVKMVSCKPATQPAAWVGLTYEEAKEIYTCIHGHDSEIRLCKAIEAKLKEKNT